MSGNLGETRGISGKLGESRGNLGEISGESRGKLGETRGISGNLGGISGKLGETRGISGNFGESRGNSGNLGESRGNSGKSRQGISGESRGNSGNLGEIWGISGKVGETWGKLGGNLGKLRGTLREFCWSVKGPKLGKFFEWALSQKNGPLLKRNVPKVLECCILVFLPFRSVKSLTEVAVLCKGKGLCQEVSGRSASSKDKKSSDDEKEKNPQNI